MRKFGISTNKCWYLLVTVKGSYKRKNSINESTDGSIVLCGTKYSIYYFNVFNKNEKRVTLKKVRIQDELKMRKRELLKDTHPFEKVNRKTAWLLIVNKYDQLRIKESQCPMYSSSSILL